MCVYFLKKIFKLKKQNFRKLENKKKTILKSKTIYCFFYVFEKISTLIILLWNLEKIKIFNFLLKLQKNFTDFKFYNYQKRFFNLIYYFIVIFFY